MFVSSKYHQDLLAKSNAFADGTKHLRELLKDDQRNNVLSINADDIVLDATRCRVDTEVLELLESLYGEVGVAKQLKQMFSGEKINKTENRAVGHVALRGHHFTVDGHVYTDEVAAVKNRIYDFAEKVRLGQLKGHSGKVLKDIVCVGIGGSYLGIEFIHEALKTNPECMKSTGDRSLRFLANVDPIDVRRSLTGLDPETTLVIVLSKTFTTAETMLNARTMRDWLIKHYNSDTTCVKSHMCAVSTNLKVTAEFGIPESNVFGFWDWVGGRFSVTSAVGVLPLSLIYGKMVVQELLRGCLSVDQHVLQYADQPRKSIPAMMALMSFYNATYQQLGNVAVLPYCQALLRFPAHIQQLAMESNGKGVCVNGQSISDANYTGEIYFGEPGTNGQHSFYQLIHQGRVVACEFIGFCKSQNPIMLDEKTTASHDELMSNFFAQPDALALGKTPQELRAENCPTELIPHKTFTGNRPSMVLLFSGYLTPYNVGQLLAIYEHRVEIEGFLWGVNSFDQWGVELGKVLAKDIRNSINTARGGGDINTIVSPTKKLLTYYLTH